MDRAGNNNNNNNRLLLLLIHRISNKTVTTLKSSSDKSQLGQVMEQAVTWATVGTDTIRTSVAVKVDSAEETKTTSTTISSNDNSLLVAEHS